MHFCQDNRFIEVIRTIRRNAMITPVLLVKPVLKQQTAQHCNLFSDLETQYESTYFYSGFLTHWTFFEIKRTAYSSFLREQALQRNVQHLSNHLTFWLTLCLIFNINKHFEQLQNC